MAKIAGVYILIQIGIIILAAIAFKLWDKRYRKNHGSVIPAGFEQTKEITIDPSNGRRFRVYYNSLTGERYYHEEKQS